MLIAETHRDATVIGVDPSRGMLAEGERKIAAAGSKRACLCVSATRRISLSRTTASTA